MNPQQPPSPQPIEATNITRSPTEKKARIYSWTSILIALAGLWPLVIYVLSALDGFGIAIVLFLLIGLVIHAPGILLGFLALLSGNKLAGIIGMIGNGMIAVIALLAFMFSLSLNRY